MHKKRTMKRQLKTILRICVIIIMAVSVIGIPSFYHHCLLHGDHNWHVGFAADTHDEHCICCEDTDDECCHATADVECCKNVEQQHNKLCITHSKCCNLEIVLLHVIATEYFPKQQIKQLLNFISCFDIPCQYISTGIFSTLNFSTPLPYPDVSPPRAAIFLFTQFLL